MTFFFCIYVGFNISVSQDSTVLKCQFPWDTHNWRWPTGISNINFYLTCAANILVLVALGLCGRRSGADCSCIGLCRPELSQPSWGCLSEFKKGQKHREGNKKTWEIVNARVGGVEGAPCRCFWRDCSLWRTCIGAEKREGAMRRGCHLHCECCPCLVLLPVGLSASCAVSTASLEGFETVKTIFESLSSRISIMSFYLTLALCNLSVCMNHI